MEPQALAGWNLLPQRLPHPAELVYVDQHEGGGGNASRKSYHTWTKDDRDFDLYRLSKGFDKLLCTQVFIFIKTIANNYWVLLCVSWAVLSMYCHS